MMDQSIQYPQVMPNFDSVYNFIPNSTHKSTSYMPMTSSSTYSNRSISPPLTSSSAKFNFDLYNPIEYQPKSLEFPSSSSSAIIHHHPVCYHSPPPPPLHSQAISKLRQINDELSHTLAKCELNNQYQPLPSPPPVRSHHYIHHHPISHEINRSQSSSERDVSSSSSSSSSESEPVKRKNNARIKYKAHIPRRTTSLSNLDQVLISTSDAYSSQDPMTVDLYPTRDHGFVRQIRNRPDNQSPWLDNVRPTQQTSYSTVSTSRTPRAPVYSDIPLQPRSRLASGKVRSRSSSANPRIRRDSAPSPIRRSTTSFSASAPVWRPNGSIKRPKFIGSHAPPSVPKPRVQEPTWNPASTTIKTKYCRAFDPTSKPSQTKTREPLWNPTSKSISAKYPRYFEPSIKPELVTTNTKEKETSASSKTVKNPRKIPRANPLLKTRIANAESKVKSAWQGTAPNATAPKPPIPEPPKPVTKPPTVKVKPVITQPKISSKRVVPPPPPRPPPPPQINIDTGRSSLNNIPTKPMFQSTPKNQSMTDNGFDDVFDNESQALESSRKPDIPHQPPQIEKTPPKLPQANTSETGKGTKLLTDDDVSKHTDAAADSNQQDEHSLLHSEKDSNDGKDENPLSHPILPKPSASTQDTSRAHTPKQDNKKDDASIIDNKDETINEEINESYNSEDNEKDPSAKASLDGSTKGDMDASQVDPTTPERTTPPPRPAETSTKPPVDEAEDFFS